ncbi:SecDF P1 head subdomain-containing protein [Actinokineospora bangkokensis]|uniref:SecDF P1 head subdomain domain-containing protein n=1 Tax=Actinokineospora bangkokensis TaxID=1193682 RepID=A0A1Q9LHE5_9PSEU|nr:hypothetical protein [Actinokineospora bangkokensis]OLR91430.1 hypothetical protein BJP25_00915 [Actinokineospora bangkokensis]
MAGIDCDAAEPGGFDAEQPLVACAEDGSERFVLDKALFTGEGVSAAKASKAEYGSGWAVTISLRSAEQRTWTDYTTNHLSERVAFVVDGRVVSAPTIQGAITGDTTITGGSGGFTEDEATDLAKRLGG